MFVLTWLSVKNIRATKTYGERGIARYLFVGFANQCMFPWDYVIELLATSSMWSTIDKINMLWSILRFDITSVVGVFGYMFGYPLWYISLLITDMMMSLHFSLDLDLEAMQLCGLITYLVAVGWLRCGLSISTRLFQCWCRLW